jgi:hypothetical protein
MAAAIIFKPGGRFDPDQSKRPFSPIPVGPCLSKLNISGERRNMKSPRSLICIAALLALSLAAQAQTWTPLKNPPPVDLGTALLLTDGTVMAQGMQGVGSFGTGTWYQLTPDNTGSYINGTWKTKATMPNSYQPLYYASAVLPDGRLVVVGGEYDGNQSETNQGAIYNPVTNVWTAITPPTGWTHIGDAVSVVLPNGTFMIGNCGYAGSICTNQTFQAQLNAKTLTWTIIGAGNGKADQNSEEGWTLLPNGTVLDVDMNDGTNSEVFNPATKTWSSAGSTIVKLANTSCYEIGPQVLRPDGTVFAIGGTSNTSVYNTSTGVWTAGPVIPGADGVVDGPASILPDGNVLMDVAPTAQCYEAGSKFYEFNGTTLTATAAPAGSSGYPSYYGRLLVLPTGQVLFTGGGTVEVYNAAGTYQSAWQPTITTVASTLTHGSKNNKVTGTQFNGLTQGAMYGDDGQMATNYPLVRITNNATGHVRYCKTHNHSTMAVATGSKSVFTAFDVPAAIETGVSTLVVVANGIPSAGVTVTID